MALIGRTWLLQLERFWIEVRSERYTDLMGSSRFAGERILDFKEEVG